MFETTVDEIMGVFTKTITKLEQRAASCDAKVEAERDVIRAAKCRADKAEKEAARASTLAKKLTELVS